MKNDEFVDTYSDDIIYLQEARKALLTHPLRNEIPVLCNASLCRIYAIMMIGNIESMLERWRDRNKPSILDAYFAKDVTNADRVNSLRDAFKTSVINVQPDVFDDYLAIKYIRNAIVHASWETPKGKVKQNQIDWILERGFPCDTRKLTSEHWQRFEWVNENMIFYIGLAGIHGIRPQPNRKDVEVPPDQLLALNDHERPLRPLPDLRGIIGKNDWPRLFWSNLERISSAISAHIAEAAASPEYSWTNGLTETQIKSMSNYETKKRFYQSAQIAAKQGFGSLQDSEEYADNAVWCWDKLVSLVPEFSDLSVDALDSAANTFRIIHQNNIHPRDHIFPPLREDTPLSIWKEFVEALFENINPLTASEVAEAYRLGQKAKRAFKNVVPLSVFAIQLPIIAHKRCQEWNEIAEYVIKIFEVGQSWYSSVEGHPSPHATTNFFRQMSATLSETR